MGQDSLKGECCICGDYGILSYEHVPPRAAFNDRPIVAQTIDEIIRQQRTGKSRKQIMQRGAGAHTLCGRCNSLTGHWYGKNFVDWVYQGMQILIYARKAPTLYYNFHILPLRVIKQIVCMFFSVNGPQFRKAQPELERFVRDRKSRHLPSAVRIFIFYAVGGYGRQSGITARISTDSSLQAVEDNCAYAEIVFPPFGYVMVFDRPPDERLLDISRFGEFGYNDYKPMPLQIPVLPAINHMPGDYRTQSEIDKAIAMNTGGYQASS